MKQSDGIVLFHELCPLSKEQQTTLAMMRALGVDVGIKLPPVGKCVRVYGDRDAAEMRTKTCWAICRP